MPELELSPQKKYNMPAPLFIKSIDGFYLVISKNTANWLLLQNEKQLEIFSFLADGNSVLDTFSRFQSTSLEDIYKVLVELEAKKFENQEVHYPQEHGMYLYLTNRCNQRCRHCYMYAGEKDPNELFTYEIINILTSFSRLGGKVVTFTGGEAALHPGFCAIVGAAKGMGLKVGVLSNGLLWTQEFINSVKDSIDEIQISIDGFDSESYMRVRGSDSFECALEATKRLLDSGLRVTVAITPLFRNTFGRRGELCFLCAIFN